MAASPIILVLPLLLLAGVGLAVALVLLSTRHPGPSLSDAAEAARRHAGVVSALAWLLLGAALLVGPVVASAATGLQEGLLLGLVPAGAGLAFAAVHAVGELTWPRPSGTVRRAGLARRTVRDVAPARLRQLLWGWASLLALVLTLCGLLADGRQITRTFENGSASSGPFPGWYYGLPLLAATVVVVACAEGVLRLVAGRPAVTDAAPQWDLGLRRLSAHRVLRGSVLVLGLTAAGVLFFAGSALRSVGSGHTVDGVAMDSVPHVVAGLVLMALAVVSGIGAGVVALVPGPPAGIEEQETADPPRIPA